MGFLQWVSPEIIVLSSAILLLIVDLFLTKQASRRWIGFLSLVALLSAFAMVCSHFPHPAREIWGETYRVDSFSTAFKGVILIGAFLVQLMSLSRRDEELGAREGEYGYLLLFATLGAMIMVSSADLVTLYVGLELLSITSYILVGIHKNRATSSEAAWKYLVTGGVASAFLLYGISFLYGLTGTTDLFEVQNRLTEALSQGFDMLLILSLFLMMVGLGFKIASVPFQMWAPDVYQGAPTPITVFLSVVSKAAAIGLLLRILLIVFTPLYGVGAWKSIVAPMLIAMSALSMIIGNTVALKQTCVKRMLAYSSIAHVGYLIAPIATFVVYMKYVLVPVDILLGMLFSSMFYYLVAYLFMNIGAFVVVHIVARHAKSEEISIFAGLRDTSGWLAFVMTIFLISLAGLPLTVGFFGKFHLLSYMITGQQFWLAIIMVLTTVVSYYYYFRVIRQIYFRPAVSSEGIRVSWIGNLTILICLLGTIGLAIFPQWSLDVLNGIDWFSAMRSVIL